MLGPSSRRGLHTPGFIFAWALRRSRVHRWALYVSLGVGPLYVGCERFGTEGGPSSEARAEQQLAEETEVSVHASKPGPTPDEPTEQETGDPCEREWERLAAVEALPGAPELEARRVSILARAPSTPVVFVQPPLSDATPAAKALRHLLQEKRYSHKALGEVLRRTRYDLPLRRQVFLREGYLYADQPWAALRLAELLRFDHLFNENEIVVERGGTTFTLKRRRDQYVHPDAPAQGARLLLFDRIFLPSDPPSERRHFAVDRLAENLGFSSLRVVRLTSEGALVELDHAGHTVRAVLDTASAEAALRCEMLPSESKQDLAFAREFGLRRQKAFSALRDAIDQMVEEGLPFDEPKTEIGQQDGQLRPAWITAYRKGDTRYEFNGDDYPVFDWRGQPRVPQVCVDFITDAFERAGGGWWAPRDQPRQRLPGTISFRKLGIENSRSVESLANFAWRTPEWFDVVWLPRAQRVPFEKRQAFFEHLAHHAASYQPGDVILIYGMRDDDRNHYHSFFIYESDPVSGAPTLLAANAGRPRVRTWEAEMRNAPKRSIVARIRPRLTFLELLLSSETPLRPPRRVRWIEPDDEGPGEERDDVSEASERPG